MIYAVVFSLIGLAVVLMVIGICRAGRNDNPLGVNGEED